MKIAMSIPGREPCGIRDYVHRLRKVLTGEIQLFQDPQFRAPSHQLIHVHFEPTLFRQGRSTWFPALMQRNKRLVKVVTVHEVFDQNPFLFPRPERPGFRGFWARLKYDFLHALEHREERFARIHFMADAVIVHTRHSRSLLAKKGCPADKIHVMPFPVYEHFPDPRDLPLLSGIPSDKPLILIYGFITSGVDYETVLKAFLPLRGLARLVIAGSARRKEDEILEVQLKEGIQRLGLQDEVRMLGYVAPECVDALFTRARIFIHAPRIKTASASLAQALGASLPIVATDLPHVREINAEVYCIRTYDPGNVEELTRHLQDLLDLEVRSFWREKVRQYAASHTLKKFGEMHHALYRRLLESRS